MYDMPESMYDEIVGFSKYQSFKWHYPHHVSLSICNPCWDTQMVCHAQNTNICSHGLVYAPL